MLDESDLYISEDEEIGTSSSHVAIPEEIFLDENDTMRPISPKLWTCCNYCAIHDKHVRISFSLIIHVVTVHTKFHRKSS